MNYLNKLHNIHNTLFNQLSVILKPSFLLVIRVYIASVFLKSGVQKLSNWDSTLFLFEYEYDTPLLPFELAAIFGTAAEIVLPLAILFGVFTRLSAFALFVFNIIAVYSYKSALLKGGISILTLKGFIPYGISFPRGFEDHFVWGILILALVMFGAGKFAISKLVCRNLCHNIE